MFGANMRVVKNVMYPIIASHFSIFQALLRGVNCTMFITAIMMIAARVATGR